MTQDVQNELEQFNQELAELSARQSQVDEKRRALRRNAVAFINDMIKRFSLTERDFTFSGSAAGAKSSKAAKARRTGSVRPPKYEGPRGELWSGQGRTPLWLRTLEEAGRSREEFLIRR